MLLRDYQRSALDAVLRYWGEGGGNPLIDMATGLGKSVVVANLARLIETYPQMRVLILVHVQELVEQNFRALIRMWPQAPAGIYSAGLGRRDAHHQITFASIQSVYRKARALGPRDLVLVDECFVAGTPIATPFGDRAIEDIRPGDMIFNARGVGVVEAARTSVSTDLYQVELSDGRRIQCTGNHPFFANGEWTEARRLEKGDRLFGLKDMPELRRELSTLDQAERRWIGRKRDEAVCLGKAEVLLDLVLEGSRQPDGGRNDARSGECDVAAPEAWAASPGRQWARSNSASTDACFCAGAGVGRGIYRVSGPGSWKRISNELQNRSGAPDADGCDRNRRAITQRQASGNRRKKGCVADVVRVARVSNIKCDGGEPVFNLQVSGHPSFFAHGVLTHNCHLVPSSGAGMYLTLFSALREMRPDMRVAGLTATAYRLDSGRLDQGDGKLFDEIVYHYGVGEGVDDGWLAPLTCRAASIEIDVTDVARRGGEFVPGALEAAADRDDLTRAAVTEIVKRGQDRRSWLIFCSGVKHAAHVCQAIQDAGFAAGVVTGETPKADRARMIEDFKTGRLRALTNAQVLCLDEETEILTSDGWVGIDGMTMTHKVASWAFDGSITFVEPKLIVRRPMGASETFVGVDGARNSIRVTGNHRMVVCDGEQWEIKSAESIAGERVVLPVSGYASPAILTPAMSVVPRKTIDARVRALSYVNRQRGMDADKARAQASTDVAARASMAPRNPCDLSLDECAFIGFWLGDGTLSPRCEFSQSKVYPKIIEWFDGLLTRLNFGHSRADYPSTSQLPFGFVRWSIARGTGGASQARAAGYFSVEPYLVKSGSPLLWGLNAQQYGALLHGLWMADGNHGDGECASSRGTYVVGAQGELYDLLQAIGACRGYRLTKTPIAERNPKHSKQWRLSWRICSKVELVRDRLEMEPLAARRSGERVWCVTSVTGNIITRRRGKVVVTGNTTGFDAPQTDLIAFLRPTLSTGLYVQMLGRGTRPVYPPGFDPNGATQAERVEAIAASTKPNCLVLDFAGNVRRHGPVDAVVTTDKKKRAAGEDLEVKAKIDSVRAKTCPTCMTLLGLAATACTTCGYEFPAPEPKHEAKPDEEIALLSRDLKPAPVLEYPVVNWMAQRHEKIGSPPSMRVTFYAGLAAYSEWICFEHAGFARHKAEKWWLEHSGGMPLPGTVDEALRRFGSLRQPAAIFVKREGRFDEIVARRFKSEEAA